MVSGLTFTIHIHVIALVRGHMSCAALNQRLSHLWGWSHITWGSNVYLVYLTSDALLSCIAKLQDQAALSHLWERTGSSNTKGTLKQQHAGSLVRADMFCSRCWMPAGTDKAACWQVSEGALTSTGTVSQRAGLVSKHTMTYLGQLQGQVSGWGLGC